MKIYSIYDEEFAPYGRIVKNFPGEELMEKLSRTPLPEVGTAYVMGDPLLEGADFTALVQDHLFGGMPVEIGWCNGHNTKLNCLEFHRDSEYNFGAEDLILLLAKKEEIIDGLLDTTKVKAFRVDAGVMVEIYATTLHYAPCHADPEKGFHMMVALPRGTNGEKPSVKAVYNKEDEMLRGCNKWLLAHPDTDEARDGAYVGLVGENIDIAPFL